MSTRNARLAALLFALVVVAAPVASADDYTVFSGPWYTTTGYLGYGDTTIWQDATYIDVYEFTIHEESEVVVTMTSSSFDTYLLLYDTRTGQLHEDDDSGGGTDSRISLMLAAGTYLVGANTFQQGEAGFYHLTAETTPTYEYEYGPAVSVLEGYTYGELSWGDPVLDDGSSYDLFSFSSWGEYVDVGLQSYDFDANLFIMSLETGEVWYDDDSWGDLDALIQTYLPWGEYLIVANAYHSGSTGEYTLYFDAY